VIICHCAVVGDRQVAEAVRQGVTTTAQLCRTTGAGQDCGSCVFAVRRALCDHRAAATEQAVVQTVGVDVAAS
jgi:bacterioferritin-associated ferredoxin